MKCYICNQDFQEDVLLYQAGRYGTCYPCIEHRSRMVKEYRASDKYKQSKRKCLKRRKMNNKTIISNYKINHGCCKCGYSKCCEALHLHHNDPKDKTNDICRMIKQGYSIKRIYAEMDKCIVICANCHAELHAAQRAT